MRNRLVFVFALIAIALAAVCVIQWRELAEQKAQISSLRSELESKTQQLDGVQSSQKRSDRQRNELLRRVTDLAAKLETRELSDAEAPTALTNLPSTVESGKPDADTEAFAKFLAKSMNDPENQKSVREHRRQKAEQIYGPLIKQLGLAPDEADKFKDLAADNEKKLGEKMLPFLGEDSSTNTARLVAMLAEEQKQGDARAKELLGEARFAHYHDYQQTIGDRDGLHRFELDSDANTLNDQQREQLLAIMKEEKQKVAATSGVAPAGMHSTDIIGEDWAGLQATLARYPGYSEEQLGELMLHAQETVNQRIYERAKAILTPEQLTSFGAYQTNKMEEMKP